VFGPRQRIWTSPLWEQIRDRQTTLFGSASAKQATQFSLADASQTRVRRGLWASSAFFEVMGVPAMPGAFTRPTTSSGGPDGQWR
jgi:hypothetical protein